MNGVPVDIIEEHRMQYYNRLNNINKQKQQRINWTQIQLPNCFTPTTTTPNLLYNNNTVAPIAAVTTTNTTTTAAVESNKVENDNVVTGNKLLILDAYGLPIKQEKPDKDTINTKLHIKPFLSINHTTNANVVSTVNSLNNGNVVNDSVTSVSNKFESGWDVKSAKSGENMKEEKVIYYKATGTKPLPIPLPSIPNTKLSYSTDDVIFLLVTAAIVIERKFISSNPINFEHLF